MSRLHFVLRRIVGGGIDRPLLPIVAVTFTGAISGGMLWTFIGIWATKRLGASSSQLGFGFLASATLGAVGGFAGGRLSDRIGRRPLILVGWSIAPIVPLLLLAVGTRLWVGIAVLASLGFVFSLGNAASQALVPDMLPPERHEAGYAAVRMMQNLGVTIGPPLGALLLLGQNWTRFFIGASVAAVLPLALAVKLIPKRGRYTPEPHADGGSFRSILRDRVFVLFFLSGIFSTFVYVAYEVVLPVSLTGSHGLAPSTWGFLLIINPAIVTLFQLRVTARTAHIPAAAKLSTAILLMGLPFLALTRTGALPIVAAVIFVFVIGEMLWVPTSQAVVARIAPAHMRGAYIGAFGSTWSIGFALAPFLGLQVRAAFGDSTMWIFFTTIAVIGAFVGFIACTRAFGLHGVAEGELEEAAIAATS
ncbi:MAG: MFS transporter [Gaiellaceae bacterium]